MKLIINADDFGLSKSITDGIIECIKAGAVTSTTLMTNTEWSDYTIKRAVINKLNCVGLHAVLTFGKPLTYCPSLCGENGMFRSRDKQFANIKANPEEIYNEIKAQYNYAKSKGLEITHIDSHHFTGSIPLIQNVLVKIAKELNLPLRKEAPEYPSGIKVPDIFCTDFFGTTEKEALKEKISDKNIQKSSNISVKSLKNILKNYKNTDKTVELMCHTGYMDEYTRGITSYGMRETELETLLKAKQEGVFDGINLISFKNL